MSDETPNVLEDPKVKEAIANLQSLKDKEVSALQAKVKDLEDLRAKLLAAAEAPPSDTPTTTAPASPLHKVAAEAKAKVEADRQQREADEVARMRSAGKISGEYAQYGVTYHELVELPDEVSMLKAAIAKMEDKMKESSASPRIPPPGPMSAGVSAGVRRYTAAQIAAMKPQEVAALKLTNEEIKLALQTHN